MHALNWAVQLRVMAMSDKTNDADFLQDLTFAPGWAQKPPQRQRYEDFSDDLNQREDGRGRGFKRDRNDRRREGWGDGGGGGGGRRPDYPRRPPRDDFRDRDRPAPPRQGEDSAPGQPPPFRPEPRVPGERRGPRPGPQPVVEYPFEIRFLPESTGLSVIVRKISGSHQAFPILDLARLFIDNPDYCEVRFEPKQNVSDLFFYQCKRCRWIATSEEDLRAHVFAEHFAEEFESETVACDPPSGNFVCVARCGVTGKLLAPPNHHSFVEKVTEMLRGECRHMTEEAYRARIEMVHDAAAVEEWREASRTTTAYRRKTAAKAAASKAAVPAAAGPAPAPEAANTAAEQTSDAPEAVDPAATADEAAPVESAEANGDLQASTGANEVADAAANAAPAADSADDVTEAAPLLQREQADAVFAAEVLPGLLSRVRRTSCPHAVAMRLNDPQLAAAVRQAWQREKRFPLSLIVALRGALRHKRLHVFRAGPDRGIDFVISRVPTPLNTEHAVPELKMIIDQFTNNPTITRAELLAGLGLSPEGPWNDEEKAYIEQLRWVTERGHIIEYFNGLLALPGDRPAYRNLPS